MLNMTREQLEKRNAKNLVYILKKARRRMYQCESAYRCSCCGEPLYELYPNNYNKEALDKDLAIHTDFYNMVKDILATKEHVHGK